jgi:hypothetical protein
MAGNVKVFVRETKIVCLGEKSEDNVEIVDERPEGITVRHTYRKGSRRTEFIPREKIESIIYEDEKITSARKSRKPKPEPKTPEPVAAPVPDPAPIEETVVDELEAENDDIFSDDGEFDDEDDLDDDEFE